MRRPDRSEEASFRAEARRWLEAHAERHLKSPDEMARLFRRAPEAVAETARQTFEQGVTAKDLPTVSMVWGEWNERSAEAILKASGLASSLGDARRKIAEGAVKINDEPISDSKRWFGKGHVDQETGAFKVQYGKKKIVLVKPI